MKKSIRIELIEGPTGPTVSEGTLQDIDLELLAVNGRAEKHTIRSADEVVAAARDAERHLDAHAVPKSERGGSTVKYHPAGPDSKSYKYCASSTMVTLRRNVGSKPVWYLIAVERVDVYPCEKRKLDVEISDEAMRGVVARALRAFGRRELPPKPLTNSDDAALERLAA